MNGKHFSSPRSISTGSIDAARHSPAGAVLRTHGSKDEVRETSSVNARLSCLKILAAALLKRIEAMEREIAEDCKCLDLQGEVRLFEAELIRSALAKTGGRQRRAAKLLGTKVTTLNTKIRRYGIRINDNSPVETHKTETQECPPISSADN